MKICILQLRAGRRRNQTCNLVLLGFCLSLPSKNATSLIAVKHCLKGSVRCWDEMSSLTFSKVWLRCFFPSSECCCLCEGHMGFASGCGILAWGCARPVTHGGGLRGVRQGLGSICWTPAGFTEFEALKLHCGYPAGLEVSSAAPQGLMEMPLHTFPSNPLFLSRD